MLEDIQVMKFPLDSNCFEVRSKNDKRDSLVLCGCPFEPNSKENTLSWQKDILKFRDACPENMSNSIKIGDKDNVSVNMGNEQVNISGAKLKEVGKSILDDKLKDIENAKDDEENQKINDAINNVQSITTNY